MIWMMSEIELVHPRTTKISNVYIPITKLCWDTIFFFTFLTFPAQFHWWVCCHSLLDCQHLCILTVYSSMQHFWTLKLTDEHPCLWVYETVPHVGLPETVFFCFIHFLKQYKISRKKQSRPIVMAVLNFETFIWIIYFCWLDLRQSLKDIYTDNIVLTCSKSTG